MTDNTLRMRVGDGASGAYKRNVQQVVPFFRRGRHPL